MGRLAGLSNSDLTPLRRLLNASHLLLGFKMLIKPAMSLYRL